MNKEIFTSFLEKENDYFNNPPNWLLYIGIFFIVCGYTLNVFFVDSTINANQPINNFVGNFPASLSLVLFAIIFPFIEEVAFRGWQLKSQYIRFIALGLIEFYLFQSGVSLLVLVILIPLLIYCIIYRPNKRRRILGVLLSSLLFSLLHLSNYNDISIKIFSSLVLFGGALILNYITWRYSFFIALLIHIVNNFIALNSSGDYQLTKMDDKYSLYTQTAFYCNDQENDIWQKDSIVYCGLIYNFPESYISNYLDNTEYIYQYNVNIGAEDLNIKVLFNDTGKATYQNVLNDILYTNNLRLDTVIYPYFHFKIDHKDTLNLAEGYDSRQFFRTNLSFIKSCLSRVHGIVCLKDDLDSITYLKIPYKYINVISEDGINRDSILHLLNSHKEITFFPDTLKKINVIGLEQL